MKALFLILTLGLNYSLPNDGGATVRKIQGIEIFIYSEPNKSYEVVDSGKVLVTLTGGCNEAINQAVKKAAKVNADAIIYDLPSNKWDAIKYD